MPISNAKIATSPERFEGEADCVASPLYVEGVDRAVRGRGAVWLRLSGQSMIPWIRPGDLLFVCRADTERVRPGEIVVFARDGFLVAHRVIRRIRVAGEPFFVTKGDAVLDADPPLSFAELLGRVTRIHRDKRMINLETRRWAALGRLLSGVSHSGRFWHVAARAAWRLLGGSVLR